MPRFTRVVVPGLPHHITQRGNRRSATFHDSRDREVYMRLLGEYAERHRLGIWAYVLMTNHVHLVGVPEDENSLPATIRDTHSAYAAYFNRTYDAVGHLWQGRFFSCVLDSNHLRNTVRYVELNPVRAGIVKRAEDYDWSSAAAHCGMRLDTLMTDKLPPGSWPKDWSAWLGEGEPIEQTTLIRSRTLSGRPWGSDSFVLELERRLGRRIRPRKRGRPVRKNEEVLEPLK